MAPQMPQRQVRSGRWMPSGWPTAPFKSVLLAGLALGLPIPWVFSLPNKELRFPQDWPAYVLLESDHECTNLPAKSPLGMQKR